MLCVFLLSHLVNPYYAAINCVDIVVIPRVIDLNIISWKLVMDASYVKVD